MHLFGRPVDWEALQTAVPPEVALVEDAAGALGARWQGMPCGGARRARLPLVPPAQDRHHRRGRRRDDGRRGVRPTRVRRLRHHGDRPGRRVRHAGAGPQLPAPGRPLRARPAAAPAPGGAAGGARARRGALRASGSSTSCDAARGRGRPARLAGLRRPARPPRRGARGAARARGSRRRSGRTPCTGSARTATRARSRAPTCLRAGARAAASTPG